MPYIVWYHLPYMGTDVQAKLAQLQARGWTLAAIADALGVTCNAVEKWKAGDRYPANAKSVLSLLDRLAMKKRIPKRKRYTKGNRRMRNQ
jgi:hypothetical protein